VIAALLILLAAPVARAVERDGTILEREDLQLDAEAGVLRWRERTVPLERFYLVEAEDGACLWAPDLGARLRGYELLARERTREEAERLFRGAIRCRDVELARELFELVQDLGLDAQALDAAHKRLLRLESKPRKATPQAQEVREAAARLRSVHADLIFARTEAELRTGGAGGLVLLREVLRIDPNHAGALAVLRARAPKEFPLGDAALWLEWHLDVEGRGARLVADEGFAMRQARKHWRPDLHGIEVGPALVITPVKDPRILGRMLGCCRLVSDLLAAQFAGFERRRKRTAPLPIFLFEGREEYLRESKDLLPDRNAAVLEYSAGHYSPEEGVSRLFWATEGDTENRLIGTAVHELTHHWLADVNPAYNRAERRRSTLTPGFWIVEGFADFMAEGVYDLDRGTSSLFDRRAASLDTLASMPASEELIDWKLLYGGTAVDFRAIPRQPDRIVRRRWFLGKMPVSTANLWYFQAAATCHFLYHAEDGRYRKALLEYVVNHYTDRRARMPVAAAFGLEPEELGRRVLAFAKAVADGWEPAPGKGAGNDGK